MKRVSIAFVKERFGKTPIVGAEVGVLAGTHALDILRNLPNLTMLYLIDPYQIYTEYTAADRDTIPWAKKKALQKLALFKDKIRWVYKKFEECCTKEIDQPLDFIYIDANHAYEYVKKDIILATQFVKKGGVIAGHDPGMAGVSKALKEHCEGKNISFTTANNKGEGSDWWFINA